TIRGQTVSRLEMLYPDLPITGNILVALPEGMKGAHSPIRIGIALESNSAVPDGFVVESLRAEGPVAMLCYSTSAEDLTEAAREYRILTDAKGDSKRGLLLEWYFSDSRDGNRFAIRSIKQ
ncbi:MAG: hypothetical protein KJT03_08915, partial [Verrucomicrobiae bacterium]|nr:hypothetical protein [Verrucomicrobiae bacterium]